MLTKKKLRRGDNVDKKKLKRRRDNVDQNIYIRRGDNVDKKKLYKEGRHIRFIKCFCISHIICSLFL
jgi:hypothetical protein